MLKKLFVSMMLLAVIEQAGATPERPKIVNLLIDTGPGGAPFRDKEYGPRTVTLLDGIFTEINMELGDKLVMRTFGNPSLLDQLKKPDLNRDITFTYRGAKVEDLPPFLAKQINALGQLTPDSQSDLMSALADLGTGNQCANAAVTTIILTNGIEVGEVSGNAFTLNNIPNGSPLCGKVIFVGLWVNDPKPVPGMKAKAEELFVELAKRVGFSEAEVRR